MRYLLFLLLGYIQLLWVPELNEFSRSYWLYMTVLLLALLSVRFRFLLPMLCLLFGYMVGQCIAQSWQENSQQLLSSGRDVTITASIKSITSLNNSGQRIEAYQIQVGETPISGTLRVNWREPAVLPAVGQRWQLNLRLKPPTGLGNPDGFDYQRYLVSKRVIATGYVKAGILISEATGWRAQRHRFVTKLKQQLVPYQHQALLLALSVGERSGLSESNWRLFRETGTIHLMAISGLHVGAVFVTLLLLIKAAGRLWLLSERTAAIDLHRFYLLFALSGSLLYTLLAGATVPTVRAMVFLSLFVAYQLAGLKSSKWHVLLLAMLFVLLINPYSVFGNSFWLSVTAVALVFVALDLSALWGWDRWGQMLLVPVVIFIGMLPLQMMLFDEAYWITPLANLVAIPWVSWLVLPFCLLATVLTFIDPQHAGPVWQFTDNSLDWLLTVLGWMRDTSGSAGPASSLTSYFILLAVFFLLLFIHCRPLRRYLLLLMPLPVLVGWLQEQVTQPELEITLLDVGQGLSVVVRQREHYLVYDTGPGYPSGFNMADAVLLPWLHAQGADAVDWLILSHDDLDHAGAAAQLLNQVEVSQLMASFDYQGQETVRCIAGDSIVWGKARLHILAPDGSYSGDNNNSCVILFEYDGVNRLLLTGDIDKTVERWLSRNIAIKPVDILVAPHHGSASSSSSEFLAWSQPDIALMSAGQWNRWNFPKSDVLDRYQQQGSAIYSTHCMGQIRLVLTDSGWQIESYRQRRFSPWYHKFGAPACGS